MSDAATLNEEEDDFTVDPPMIDAPMDHPLWPRIVGSLRTVFDPEIPVNIYELGLVYRVEISEFNDVHIDMTLTAPGCPVAGEMPGMIKDAVASVDGIGAVDVELVWDPPWNPSLMADTAKLQLNMY
jgi:FeS assembly SUF system protein